MKSKIDVYFDKKGIKVFYNSLGATELLVTSFVGTFKEEINSSTLKVSSEVKNIIYSKIFPNTFRHKKTGFELVKNLDNKFRTNIQKFIIEPQFSPLLLIENHECDTRLNYKQTLIDFLKKVENPLIYFSGGIDSELLLKACLSANINFNVVIFEWLNNNEDILNEYDLSHAYSFCKKHNIYPIIKQINIEKLWEEKSFKDLAIDLQIQSPHLVTHAYMIDMMSKDYINHTHMFGGEVKFKTNYLLDNGEIANLVYLDKISPGYNGVEYKAQDYGSGFGVTTSCILYYFDSLGTWEVSGGPIVQGSPTGGSWTTTPTTSYEFRITNVYNETGSAGSWYPETSTGWQAIGFGSSLCQVTVTAEGFQNIFGGATWDIEVRVIGQAAPTQSSTIRLLAEANG